MTLAWVAQAAHNSAIWCDIIRWVHGIPGEFHDAFGSITSRSLNQYLVLLCRSD